MKQVWYSYLLDGERSLRDSLTCGELNYPAILRRSEKAARKAQKEDCYMKEHTPGKIIKITLETIEE